MLRLRTNFLLGSLALAILLPLPAAQAADAPGANAPPTDNTAKFVAQS